MIKKQNGFTLMELLVVMALMSILWGVAYMMFYQSKMVFSLSSSQLTMYQYARIAIGGISQDLKGVALKNNTDYFRSFTTAEASGLTPPPRQNSSILTFLSLTPNGSSTPVTIIAYYLNNANELMRAEYNDTSYIYGAVSGFNPAAATFYKLATNVNYFNLAYNDGSTWVSSWDSTSGATTGLLPNSIRVILQIYGSGTGNTLKVGTFTTEIAIPYRITHEDEHVDGDEDDDEDDDGDDDVHHDDDDDDHHDDDDGDDHHDDDDDDDDHHDDDDDDDDHHDDDDDDHHDDD